ncbi:MAG: hypothetical protein ACI8RZ_006295 [Myxococcota bacterium]|jgi:hypothetical protein
MLTFFLTLAAHADTPSQQIDAVLADFTQGAAERDVERVESALHPEARQFVAMPDGLQVIDRESYLGLLSAGKIGGTATSRQLLMIEIDGSRATARQIRDVGALALHDTVSLMQVDGDWQIISAAIEVVSE